MVLHDLAYYVSDQITRHHVNTDVNYNNDSRSFETPRKNNYSSSCCGDTITTTTIPNLFKVPPPGKYYLSFQTEDKTDLAK